MALMATTFSAVFQLDTGGPFPCCWPVSFCHWVNRSPQCKWKHTLWKRWFYQKLILICLQHTCTVHSSGSTVLLVVPLTSIAEEVERECHRLGNAQWASGLWLGGRLLSISKSIKPVHECFLHLNSCLQHQTEEFKEEMKKKPQIVVCSAEFLASKEVRHPLIFRCLGQVMMIKISAGTFRAKCFQVKDTFLDCPSRNHKRNRKCIFSQIRILFRTNTACISEKPVNIMWKMQKNRHF